MRHIRGTGAKTGNLMRRRTPFGVYGLLHSLGKVPRLVALTFSAAGVTAARQVERRPAASSLPALWIDPGQRTVYHAELGKVKTTSFHGFALPRTNR